MKQDAQVPLMTESNDIQAQFGNNGYSKPAAGLVMLREQVLGDSLFDEAFKEYSKQVDVQAPATGRLLPLHRGQRRGGAASTTSGAGWFYTTYANDQAVANVESQKGEELGGDKRKGEEYHRVTVQQRAGLIMPIHLEITYEDGTKQVVKLPADVWRNNEKEFTWGFFGKKTVTQVVLDPKEALADVDRSNNTWKKPNTVS
jgi:hypothetical protein